MCVVYDVIHKISQMPESEQIELMSRIQEHWQKQKELAKNIECFCCEGKGCHVRLWPFKFYLFHCDFCDGRGILDEKGPSWK